MSHVCMEGGDRVTRRRNMNSFGDMASRTNKVAEMHVSTRRCVRWARTGIGDFEHGTDTSAGPPFPLAA